MAAVIDAEFFLDFQTQEGEPLFSRTQPATLHLPEDWTGGGESRLSVTVLGVSRRFRVPISVALPERVPAEGERVRMRFRPKPFRLEPAHTTNVAGQTTRIYDI